MENAEAGKFFQSFEKKISEHYETISKEENINISSEDGMVSNILTKTAKKNGETIYLEEASKKANKARKFQKKKLIVFFIQYLIASKMARTRSGLARRTNSFDNKRFAAAK